MKMQNVSREAVDQAIQKIFSNNVNKGEIEINILINSLVREFGSSLTLSDETHNLTQEQKDKLGKAVFFNPKVMKRLEEAETATKEDEISNYDEYLKYKNEVLNGKE